MPKPIAVVDIDGVVADVQHRLHFIQSHPVRWDRFFTSAADDPPIPQGIELATLLAVEHELIWLSGRPEWLRSVTTDWLIDQNLEVNELQLREDYDRRPATVLKLSRLRRIAERGEIATFVDDDPDVIRAAQRAGFPAVLAHWTERTGTDAATLRDAQQRSGRT